MHKKLLAALLLCLVCGTAAGQSAEEKSLLKALATKAGCAGVVKAKSLRLPDGATLKIFVNAGQDLGAIRQNFETWVENWNETDGAKYGLLEIVPAADQADVILARYVGLIGQTEIATGMDEIDPTATDRVTGAPAMRRVQIKRLNAYHYLLARESDRLTILWRGTEENVSLETRPGVQRSSGGGMGGGGTTLRPSDNHPPKPNLISKGAGDKLRDQLFKMMKARAEATQKK